MIQVATTSEVLAEQQAREDYIASQANPVIEDDILSITDEITSDLPNCWDFDRFGHHLRNMA